MHNNNKAVAQQQMFLARFLSLRRLSLPFLDRENNVLQLKLRSSLQKRCLFLFGYPYACVWVSQLTSYNVSN